MMRPTLFALAVLLLASCAPNVSTTAPEDIYASQNYAEEISKKHFRFTTEISNEDEWATVVVPTQRGETFLFEHDEIIAGRILALHSLRDVDRQNNAIVNDQTSDFVRVSLQAPEGWSVRLVSIQERVDFDPLTKASPELSNVPIQVDLGGTSRTTKQGVFTYRRAVEASIPLDVEPGRYLAEANYRAKNDVVTVRFIVEVL